MYNAVTQVEALKNFSLRLVFDNSETRYFNMKPYLDREIFHELKDVQLFKRVRIAFDTVEWENEADTDPETLYAGSVPESEMKSELNAAVQAV